MSMLEAANLELLRDVLAAKKQVATQQAHSERQVAALQKQLQDKDQQLAALQQQLQQRNINQAGEVHGRQQLQNILKPLTDGLLQQLLDTLAQQG